MITAALDVAAVAEQAFVLGYPLVLTQRTMARAPVNQLVLCRDTPDTLRLSAWLDLAAEPLVLSVPDTSGRYYALWMRDAFNTVFSSIGARTTGTEPRDFGVLGPDSHAVRLGSGLTTVASPTRLVHLAGCVEAVAERDDAVLDWARERFSLSPLSHWRGVRPRRRAAAAPRRSDRSPVDEVERMDARAFFAELLRLARGQPAGSRRPPARSTGCARSRPCPSTTRRWSAACDVDGRPSGPRPAAAWVRRAGTGRSPTCPTRTACAARARRGRTSASARRRRL